METWAEDLPAHLWVPRSHQVNEVRRALEARGRVLLVGVGGTGKTTLARQVGARLASDEGWTTAWIEGRDPDAPRRLDMALRADTARQLVVIDGVDEARDFGRSLMELARRADRPGLHILTTSRIDPGPDRFDRFVVAGMATDDLAELVRRRLGSDAPVPKALLDLANGNPAAATALSELIQQNGLTPAALPQLYEPYETPGLVGVDGHPLEAEAPQRSRLITDIREVNEELLAFLHEHPEQVHKLKPRQFEEVSAEIFHRLGYDVQLTPASKDGGLDLYVGHKSDLGTFVYYVECKRYAPDRPVGVGLVNALVGVVERGRATAGLLLTTSHFTSGARKIEREQQSRLSLKDYADFRSLLAKSRNAS